MHLLLKIGLMLGIAVAFFPLENHILILACLAGLMAIVLFVGWIRKEFQIKKLFNPYTLLLLLIFYWSVLSGLWVRTHTEWLNAVEIVGISLIFCLVLTLLGRDGVWRRRLSWYIMLILAVHHVIGWYFVYQYQLYLSLDQVIRFNLVLSSPAQFYRNINDYALMMFFSLFFSFALSINIFQKPQLQRVMRLVKYILIASSFALIIFTGSRGIAGAAFVSMGVYLFLHIKERRIRLTLMVLGVILVGLFLAIFYEVIYASLANDSSAVVRLNLIRNGGEYLKNSSGLGVGAGNVEYYLKNNPYHWTGDISLMHNWFMEVLTSNGIIVGGLYGLYYIRSLFQSYRLSIEKSSLKSKFVFSWLAGFIIAGAIPDNLFPYLWFWLIHHVVFLNLEQDLKSWRRL